MAPIGPTLPPHLAKRKRTSDNDTPPDPPPSKIHASEKAQTHTSEVELDSNCDNTSDYNRYGPVAPEPNARESIGPSLPPSIGPSPPIPSPPAASAGPSLPPANVDEVALDSEDDESIGPAAPPTTNTTRIPIGPTLPSTNTEEISLDSDDEDDIGPAPPEPKRVHGPALPPAPLSERPPDNADSDDDTDDDYGPALPSSKSHQERQARALKAAEAEAEAATNQAPKRDDWMLAPPSAGGYRAADPTKLKARRFNSGPRANTGTSGEREISSIWTETPEEKRKRLENAVLGRDAASGPSTAQPKLSATGDDDKQATRIRNFTEATRGRSLYEEHQEARTRSGQESQSKTSSNMKKSWVDEEEDDPSKRAFDKEKDMKLGGRIGAAQRRELLNKAADFGGRFSKGKYL
ncbi:hypothetical protein GGS21DRAFT_502342 [Xylaria nigripes]|nr:hypothetical protein GGS21DRAFT_502342 [Xylaria nigripes]